MKKNQQRKTYTDNCEQIVAAFLHYYPISLDFQSVIDEYVDHYSFVHDLLA